MKKSKTNLEYLMTLCNIKGVEIAKFLHVDQSLVGKWKNGARNLSPESSYIDQLATLFIQKGQKKIEKVFENLYKDSYNHENLPELTKAFICSTDPEFMAKSAIYKNLDADYSTVYYTYGGISGRKKAMNYFLDCAENAGASVTIFLHDASCFEWLVSDDDFFENWCKRIVYLLSNESDVYLTIDINSDNKKAAAFLYKIYPLATNRHFNIYYVDGTNCSTSYIIGGLIAVKGYNDDDYADLCTQVFTDHAAVKIHEIYARNLLKMRIKDSIKRLSAKECFENVENLNAVSNDIYMFSSMPTFFSMPPKLLEKILTYNKNLSDENKNNLKTYNALANKEFFHSKNTNVKCIFFLEQLKFLSQQKEIFYYDELYGKETIMIKNDDFKAHIKFLAQKLFECDRYCIALIPNFKSVTTLSKLGYLACKKHCWTIISNEHSGTSKALFSLNQNLSELFFSAQECAWKEIPQAYTNKQNIKKLLEEIALGDK